MKLSKNNKLAGIGKLSRSRLAEVLQGSDGGCITAKYVAKFLKVSIPQARSFLSYWAKNGWLLRIHQGVYLPIDIAAKSPNQTEIDPWIVAYEIFSPCYIGGWSAIQHWGLTEQIFESTIVMISKRINGKKQDIGRLRFLLKKLAPEKKFGLKSVWKNQVKILVSDPHKTIVDMLDDPSLGGGIRSTLDFLQKYLSSSYFDREILLKYAQMMSNKTIFKRLGFALSRLNFDDQSLINYCRKNISKGNSQLDPSSKGHRLIKKWGLWIPEGFEK